MFQSTSAVPLGFTPAACGPMAPHSGQRMQMTRSGSSPTVIRSGRSWAQKGKWAQFWCLHAHRLALARTRRPCLDGQGASLRPTFARCEVGTLYPRPTAPYRRTQRWALHERGVLQMSNRSLSWMAGCRSSTRSFGRRSRAPAPGHSVSLARSRSAAARGRTTTPFLAGQRRTTGWPTCRAFRRWTSHSEGRDLWQN